MVTFGMVTFGMGISIPEEELDLCHELANTAYLNLGLTNDLYSWQKEYETAQALGQDFVVNVIAVLMEEHNISEEQAKALCKEKIKTTIVDFQKIVRDTNERTDISVDLKRYLEGLLYSLSGNLVWSLECPRYHPWASYNETQLDLMKNGIPKRDKVSTNGAAIHENASSEPKAIERNAVCNGLVSYHTPELTNGSKGLQTRSDDDLSSNGIAHSSLVNVFVAKRKDGLNTVKLHDRPTSPSADGVFQQDM